ncbi:5065_t:CDS:2 [Paraglomus brasilianum]|uniref:5065_t:CDS:1 n=1 Tax=Paraglomus brasilianum TaxID=144538 RepID=A0A9N9F4W9_9GLOM|nr:5065_t:CDS:2 [Paraglomus brasilianum]
MAKSKQSNATASSNGKATTHWLFQEYEITIRPITLLSLLTIILAVYSVYYTGEYREKVQLCEPSLTEGKDEITWIELPRAKPTDSYASLSNGAFVFRRIYMDDFWNEFWVEPINWPEFDEGALSLIERNNLQKSIFQAKHIQPNVLKTVLNATDKYTPKVKEIELADKNGTYIDDRSMYVRWVDDNLRFGLFAGRNLRSGEVLGVYAGEYVSDNRQDYDYAWEYNYLVQLEDENEKPARLVIDAKYKGNYLRFANHKDVDYNGDATYIIYNNMWLVVYVVNNEIKMDEQIFVNYGEAYWAERTRY